MPSNRPKSFSREVGLVLLAVLLVFCVAHVLGAVGALEIVKLLVAPIFAFAMGAFGLDKFLKQRRNDE